MVRNLQIISSPKSRDGLHRTTLQVEVEIDTCFGINNAIDLLKDRLNVPAVNSVIVTGGTTTDDIDKYPGLIQSI